MDHDRIVPNKFMAKLELPLKQFINSSEEHEMSEILTDKKGQPTLAKIDFKIVYKQPAKTQDKSQTKSTGKITDTPDTDTPGSITVDDQQSDQAGLVSTGVAKESGLALKALNAKYSTKPQDFQIRVKVIRGRQLQGSNISPLVKVACAGLIKQTRVQRSTNSPFFNEIYFFNFHESQAELLSKTLEFSIYDSKQFRTDAFLGSFSIDLAFVYEAEDHSLINRWMLMGNPDDVNSGAKGYLQMSVVIVGPGDNPPAMSIESEDDDSSTIEADKVSFDDPIGSTSLVLSEISSQGSDGFLPNFGPCFLNFYGSQRDYSIVDSERTDKLNLGKGEGVAYRGRLLVQVHARLLDDPLKDEVKPIEQDEIERVQKVLRRRRFKLFTSFLSASMLPGEQEKPIEFETSIGCFGNTLDSNVPPCPSTTPPTNPVFDGKHFSFLPWGGEKPCTIVDCQWEDISYRLFAVNHLKTCVYRLDSVILFLEDGIKSGISPAELILNARDEISEFLASCNRPIPKWNTEQSPETELDKNLCRLRDGILENARDSIHKFMGESHSPEELLEYMNDLRSKFAALTIQPQKSIPDVIISMLEGGKQKAYARIDPRDILYSKDDDLIGTLCGTPKTIDLKFPSLYTDESDRKWGIAAQVRVVIILTLEKEDPGLPTSLTEGELRILAETYENQASILGSWGTKMVRRPDWSDVLGKTELQKDWFNPPREMTWKGDWYNDPEQSFLIQKDVGQDSFVEDVYYNETRTPTSTWSEGNPKYSDYGNDERAAPENIPLPQGWSWTDEWKVDLDRQCDEEGYEYAVNFAEGSFVGTEKLYHMFRRKRLTRERKIGEPGLAVKQGIAGHILGQKDSLSTDKEGGWTYAYNWLSNFHKTEKRSDSVRRRRWHRQLVYSGRGQILDMTMQITSEKETKPSKKKANLAVPRIILHFDKPHNWQLNLYIYQARNVRPSDRSGLSDPYLVCEFAGMTQSTYDIQQTVSPLWDQTLIFSNIQLFGHPDDVRKNPPQINIGMYDKDMGDDELIGRCKINPEQDEEYEPILEWYKFKYRGRDAGELLAAYDLICLDGIAPPLPPPRRSDIFVIPDNVRPKMRRTAVEILCWGVRDMAKYKLSSVDSPSIDFEIGGKIESSNTIHNVKKDPNFDTTMLFIDAYLPEEPDYMPPLNISCFDHRIFGMKPNVGNFAVTDLTTYKCTPLDKPFDPKSQVKAFLQQPVKALPMITSQDAPTTALTQEAQQKLESEKKLAAPSQVDVDFDWWSKFYASLGETQKCLHYLESGYDKLMIYDESLEGVYKFHGFTDFADTFTLKRGKNLSGDEDDYAGQFKGTFRIYELPEGEKAELPPRYFEKLYVDPKPQKCIIRVYLVRAMNLQPKDRSGLSDPFVEIELGRQEKSTKKHYIPNTLNPEFGTMVELTCIIPIEKDLKIRVMDFDRLRPNELIGETVIDLENRYLTKYRATCGLPQSYCTSGINTWRDCQLPSEILKHMCEATHRSEPVFQEPSNENASYTCRIDHEVFKLEEIERGVRGNPHLGPPKERLCLHVLNRMDLLPEHVEKRTLFSPLQPGISQGNLEMWVDIFPESRGKPGPAFDITPRKPLQYELRIIVWSTENCELLDTNVFGEKMSDLFVKGWLSGVDDPQKTDIHYRSMNGEGLFNWRFVFPFGYMPAENLIVIEKKEHFWSLDPTVRKVKPQLIMQVWDNDMLKPNEFIGSLQIDLAQIPTPVKWARQCDLKQINSDDHMHKPLNIFEDKRAKGYWPFVDEKDGKQKLTGKLCMEMQLVNGAEAKEFPAGLGREKPNENPHLEPPKRPATSFFWLTSPFKSFKYIFWPRFKKILIILIIVVLLALLIALFIYAVPRLLARKMILG